MSEIYADYYKKNRTGNTFATSITQKMESWLHKQVAKDIANVNSEQLSTLEIGAGTLNHLPYEPNILEYDIIEPFNQLYEDSNLLNRVKKIYSDIVEIPFTNKYDRIVSVATFEHILNLPDVVSRAAILLNNGGCLRVAIPSEGEFLWGLGWRLTTGIEFRIKYGIDYGELMRYEHINSAREIKKILNYFFEVSVVKSFGVGEMLSFYQFIECRNPNIERCKDFLRLAK
jgi:SAM-dependent methyltransferase